MANIGFEPFNLGATVRNAQTVRNLKSRENILDQQGAENEQNRQLKNTQLL